MIEDIEYNLLDNKPKVFWFDKAALVWKSKSLIPEKFRENNFVLNDEHYILEKTRDLDKTKEDFLKGNVYIK